jgi:4-hydroxy-tetrahydrodipicolinate synthase
MLFSGSMVALVTPMTEQNHIDKKALANLIEWHIEVKTDALVVAGTTGEAATLEIDEQKDLISFIVKQGRERIPIIVGSGSNATQKTLHLSKQAADAGADACLIVTPYYNKPTQLGLYTHYKTLADQLNLPIIIYNVPSRTGCDILPETIAELAQEKQIIGIKEATGKIERACAIQKLCGKNFAIYSGDDATALALMQQANAKGVISVTANIVPADMQAMCASALQGDFTTAQQINAKLNLLHERLFLESNPIPVKWALAHVGKITPQLRLPLLPLAKQHHAALAEAMAVAGVI